MTKITELPATARVWVYLANRPFPAQQKEKVDRALQEFARSWVSHARPLTAAAELLQDRFVVLAVDEKQAGASGCSIDKSVHFLRQLQADYQLDLFDRMVFAYQDEKGEVQTADRTAFQGLYHDGKITDDTLVYDTMVATVGSLSNDFLKPLGESWHKRMV